MTLRLDRNVIMIIDKNDVFRVLSAGSQWLMVLMISKDFRFDRMHPQSLLSQLQHNSGSQQFPFTNRFRAVVHPWKPRFTSIQTTIIIATTWSVSYVLVIPYLLVLSIKDNYCGEVWPSAVARRTYTLGLFVIQFVVPIFIIAFAYTKVVLKLRDQAARFAVEKKDQDTATPEITRAGQSSSFLSVEVSDVNSISGSPLPNKKFTTRLNKLVLSPKCPRTGQSSAIQRLERNTKIVKMLLTVVLLYVVCMLPNQVVWLWYEFGSGQNSPYLRVLLTLGSSMVYLNSSVNPILYAGMNDEFRRGFINLLRCRCRRPINK